MSVLVRNESAEDYIFRGSAGRRTIAAGETEVVSDAEWNGVATSMRGPGKLNPLYPTEDSAQSMYQVEYEEVLTNFEVKYLGIADSQALTSDHVWTIKKFSYISPGGAPLISGVEVMLRVAWDDRATLPWS